jgi:predicted aconitase
MYLTKEEMDMLHGSYGYPVKKAMEILVGLGECYDAKRMIPIVSVHLPGCGLVNAGRAGAAFVQKMADKGGKFIPFTDTNITSIDPWKWQGLGIAEDFVRDQMAMTAALGRMGAYLCNSCTPYLVGHVPGLGEHIAWGESSAIIFANSVLGARTNREGGPSALAAALTGRVPEYGYHLDRDRYGDLKFVITTTLQGISDYGTLGYFAGRIAEERVPVFVGLPRSTSWDELKQLGAAVATSGSAALFHAVGITPEASSEEVACGGRKIGDSQTFEFGKTELCETEARLSKANTGEVDLVLIGCPHASISQIKEVGQLLSGKKVKSGVELWVMTSHIVRAYAEKMGYVKTIETSGAKIIREVCPSTLPRGFLKEQGLRTVATDSAKMTYYCAGMQDVPSHYGSTSRCVETAISGQWR